MEGDIGRSIKRTLHRLLVATLILYAVNIGLLIGGVTYSVSKSNESTRVHAQATRLTIALCALRHDLETRVATSTQFLKDNPHGIPGISPLFIHQSLDGQKRTVAVLSIINCSR